MIKKIALTLAAATMAATAAPAAVAELPGNSTGSISVRLFNDAPQYADDDDDDRRGRRGRGHARGHYKHRRDRHRVYDDRGYYVQPRRISRNSRVWRGRDGRYHCRRDNGTTGLIIGAGIGALAGRELTRDRTLGAILGAAAGGLLGREIDRGSLRCR